MFSRLIAAKWFVPAALAAVGLLVIAISGAAYAVYRNGQIEGRHAEQVAALQHSLAAMEEAIAMRDRIISADAERYRADMEKYREDLARIADAPVDTRACLDPDLARRVQSTGR